MKTAVMAAVAAGLAWGTAAFGATDAEVAADFLENFRVLAAVPRPSHHEKAIADRLQAWAEERGFETKRNGEDELVFDVPATEGLEGLPLVALQAHMDMVCVGAEGKEYDPLADPIRLVLDEEAGTLTADGTSLGADDGAGVTMVMSIAKGLMAHGPLRVVFTTDEEDGMSGVLALGKEDVAGVKYLINVDSERSDAVTVSSAADAIIVATAAARMVPAEEGTATLEISVSGLRGGAFGDGNRGGEVQWNQGVGERFVLHGWMGRGPVRAGVIRGRIGGQRDSGKGAGGHCRRYRAAEKGGRVCGVEGAGAEGVFCGEG